MTTRSRLKRALGVMGAGALALMLGISGTVSAHAAPGDVDPTQTTTVDGTKTGSIEIFKKLNPTSVGGPATGDVVQNVTGQGLNGVTFDAFKLDYDLTDSATWETLKNLAPGKNLQNLTAANIPANKMPTSETAPTKTGKTAAGGTPTTNGYLKLEGLPVGVYLVKENIATVNPPVPGLAAGPNFLVFIPTTSENGLSWDYDITVYPKNTATSITKKVLDADKNVGDTITYSIDADIPAVLSANESLSKYIVSDQLPPVNQVNPGDTDWPTSTKVRLVPTAQAATAVTPGNINTLGTLASTDPTTGDFKVAYDPTTNKLTVTATQKGLTMLRQQAGNKVRVVITAKLKEIGSTNGIIVNESQLITHQPGAESDTIVDSNEVTTYLGKAKIVKTDNSNSALALSGAEFELYRQVAEGEAGANLDLGARGKYSVVQVNINGTNKWTTGDDGTVTIDGLHVTDIEDDDKEIENRYFLKETKAPAGYVTPTGMAQWTDFTLSSENTEEVVISAEQRVEQIISEVSIENTRSDVPNLPLTGGKGIALIVVLGVAVAGAAIFSARRNSRKA